VKNYYRIVQINKGGNNLQYLKSASVIVFWLLVYFYLKSNGFIEQDFIPNNVEYVFVGLLVYVEVRLLVIKLDRKSEAKK
tara:strand:- start:1181 stop:1420 length:240 start_codon:yes stop_codon:yes gene_type:complete